MKLVSLFFLFFFLSLLFSFLFRSRFLSMGKQYSQSSTRSSYPQGRTPPPFPPLSPSRPFYLALLASPLMKTIFSCRRCEGEGDASGAITE